jgi:hypothetical protein
MDERGMLVSGYPLLQFRQDERQLARQEVNGCDPAQSGLSGPGPSSEALGHGHPLGPRAASTPRNAVGLHHRREGRRPDPPRENAEVILTSGA